MKYFGLNCEEEIANDIIKEIEKDHQIDTDKNVINIYARGIILIADYLVHDAFDRFDVPRDDMTLKERLAYYYLLTESERT